MSKKSPTFEHRHYKALAAIIADMVPDERYGFTRADIAEAFASRLEGTNPNYNRGRFLAAAMGNPSNGRDRV